MDCRRWLALGVLAWSALATPAPGAEQPTRAFRLIDHAPGMARTAVIDATQKGVLDTIIGANVIALPEALPAQPVLTFAVGMAPGAEPVTVRYTVAWKPPDRDEEQLYTVERTDPGWLPVRIDLAGRDPRGASLIFRRVVVAGRRRDVMRSSWGDPVITSAAEVPAGAPPSVILISIDTLRADRVGLYGYAKANTPTLDSLGRTGTWYEHAYSASGWTLPSHASLFYSGHLAFVPPDPPGTQPGTARAQSIAEVLRAHGFLTAGFTGGGWMAANFGFARGFDTFYAFPQPALGPGKCPPERLDGKTVFNQAIAWLRDRGRTPFFLLLHTYDVHDRCPFRKPDPGGFVGWRSDVKRSDLLSFYDDLIAATDGLLGQLVAELDRLGLGRNTILAVTSDHGEFFDEHGLQGHGCVQKPYEQLVHVPLIIHDPTATQQPAAVSQPVSMIDVAPTILTRLQVPVPPSMEGTVLPGLGLAGGKPQVPVYTVCDDVLMVRDERDKLILSRSGAFQDELFNLAADPQEIANLAYDGARVAPLRAIASGLAAFRPPATPAGTEPTQAIDDSTKERLRALGY